MADVERLETRMAGIEKAVVRLETQVEKLASREWVLIDVVAPIKEAVSGIEHSVKSLATEGRELYDAHKEFLKQEAARREKEILDKTLPAILKKWGALVGILIGSITFFTFIFRVLGTAAELWLKSKGY
jgi:uncharacterized protein YoxC